MARSFSPEFNAYARRVVKSARQRIRRAEARGMKNLPEIPTLRQLKARNQTVTDLKRELTDLRKLNTDKDALQRHFLGQGAVINWEFNHLKNNLQELKTFYDLQIKMAKARYKSDPYDYGLKQQIVTMEDRRDYLNRDINKLSYSELKTFRKYLSQYKNYTRKDINYYDRYLKSLDALMKQSGVDKKTISELRDKFANMPREVFMEMYRQHDVVNDLFQIDPSPEKYEAEEQEEYEKKKKAKEEKQPQLDEDQISNINEKASAMVQKVDGWANKAENDLAKKKNLKLSASEEKIYNKIYGGRK